MKYYILLFASLLLALAAGTQVALASTSVNIPVPSSYLLSDVARATDNGSSLVSPGPGAITLVSDGQTLFVKVPAPAREGTRLETLDDYESGIVFRNNTMLLPVYSGGAVAGVLTMATDNLTAEADGYFGEVTGLELDTSKVSASANGSSFTAGAAILLTGLAAGAAYETSLGDNDTVTAAIEADLTTSGLAPADISPVLDVEGNAAGATAISYVIVTVETDRNWSEAYGGDNVTFYSYNGSQLSRLPYRLVDAGNGSVAYQAIADGPGQFAVVPATPLRRAVAVEDETSASPAELALIGGALAVLLLCLAVMVRRVMRR